MFNFETTDFQRVAVSAVGALVLSTASVFAAAAPAKAATLSSPVTVADWRGQVEKQLDGVTDTALPMIAAGKVARTNLALRFTAEGDFAGASVVKSSGNARIDARAMRIARHIAYPALPAGYRGQPQTVEMRLVFGSDATATETVAQDRRDRAVQTARADRAGTTQLAAR